ncbi:MAG TPA: glycosyltransferase family 2 protein [Longimicrobiales bacterium]|nr:glycosyltransferase family 2 protein [Longimicrobiales bacterium]
MARVSVVIPSWNGASLLPIALRSLRAQTFTDFDVVVVDNGSTDGTAALMHDSHPEARLVGFAENRGFAAAVNAGIAASDAPYVALLNNDAEAHPEWLRSLVRALDSHPDAGAAASRVLQRRDPTQIDSAGDTFGVLAYSIGHGDRDGPAYEAPAWVPSACAAAALYRRTALQDVGPFDEGYFAYLEDVDLGLRLLLRGWRTRYVPEAVTLHEGSVTASRIADFKLRLLLRNSARLFIRCAPAGRLLLLGPALAAWMLLRGIRELRPGLAALALVDCVMSLPELLRERRALWRGRRISRAAYRAMLAPPLRRWSPAHPPLLQPELGRAP